MIGNLIITTNYKIHMLNAKYSYNWKNVIFLSNPNLGYQQNYIITYFLLLLFLKRLIEN